MKHQYKCPKCDTVMTVLLFMGVQLDGYICPTCNILYPVDENDAPQFEPLAKVF